MIYKQKPPGFKPSFTAVGCYIKASTGRILLLLRAKDKKWGSPAGHVEDRDVCPREAAVRELFEETGIKILASQFGEEKVFYVDWGDRQFVYYAYEMCFVDEVPIILSEEHQDYVWIHPKNAYTLHLVQDQLEAIQIMCPA